MVVIHGKGGHGKVVADACDRPFRQTDDAEGTRPQEGDFYIVAIGDNRVRQSLGGNYNIIHRSAVIRTSIIFGKGVYIGARAVINPGAKIGDGVIINTGAIVEHDCIVGDFAHIASGAVLCGGVTVGEGALIGAGSVVKPGVSIGAWAVIGCGAAVVGDVPEMTTRCGVPAR